METEQELNPWITVSKKKGIRPLPPVNAPTLPPNGGIESQANAFVNLRIQEPGEELPNGSEHRPPTPSESSPPRKKPKKDPMKVLHFICDSRSSSHIILPSK